MREYSGQINCSFIIEIIKEVEEEGNEKSTLRAKHTRKSRDKKTSLEKNIEVEKPVKRAFVKHDTVNSEETIQFDRWHHKHTTTGSETITQIQKKHTESDFFNSATKRMRNKNPVLFYLTSFRVSQ